MRNVSEMWCFWVGQRSWVLQLLLGGHQKWEIERLRGRRKSAKQSKAKRRKEKAANGGDNITATSTKHVLCMCVGVFVSWRFAWFVQIRRIVVAAILFAFAYRGAFCLYMCICICICICVGLLARVCCVCELGSSSFICLPCCCCLVLFGRFWFGFLGWMILYGRWSVAATAAARFSIHRLVLSPVINSSSCASGSFWLDTVVPR